MPAGSVSVQVAEIVGMRSCEIEVGGKTTHAVSRSIPEQKVLLETLGVPPLPSSI
ncbi:MAG TPA: hypothetical protein PK416_06570 [Thermodesulfobacteriota bacterium]|nr:hypothetical protein [Thermodesulfobacteriota bacterium]